MKGLLSGWIGLTVALLQLLGARAVDVSSDFTAPEFSVDLDVPASDRWVQVLDTLLEARGYEYTWKPLHDFLESALSPRLWRLSAPLWDLVLGSFPVDQRKEVVALHEWFNSKGFEWTLGQCVMVQLFYEVEDGCTSIVAQHANGSIFHGRNLDYGLPGLQNFTATVNFLQAGVPLYRGTMYVGYFGILTGQRLHGDGKGAWSVSLNQRDEDVPYVRTVAALIAGAQNVGFRLRTTLATKTAYADAVKTLRRKLFSAPAYLALAGTAADEGAIITRDRMGVTKAPEGRGFLELNSANGTWYRMETNYDNWEPTPKHDPRREVAADALDKLGQDSAHADGLMSVLETAPVMDRGFTTYSTIMLNEAGYYRTVVRAMTNAARAEELRATMMKRTSAGLRELLHWYKQQSSSESATELVV